MVNMENLQPEEGLSQDGETPQIISLVGHTLDMNTKNSGQEWNIQQETALTDHLV